jgi:hypothetical protein
VVLVDRGDKFFQRRAWCQAGLGRLVPDAQRRVLVTFIVAVAMIARAVSV